MVADPTGTAAPASRQPLPIPHIVRGLLEVVPVPGKGLGYRAARQIRRGDALLHDRAFCSAPAGTNEYCNLSQQCVQLADALGAERFWELVGTLAPGNAKARNSLRGILENNVFACSREPDQTALFIMVARFNHSCCPNAFVDATASSATVRALQDIPVGEEVCISYVPVSLSLQRRRKLLSGKDFTCRCRRCEEEEALDPSFAVPCECGKAEFSAQATAPAQQRCRSCGACFDRAASLQRLLEVEAANAHMRTPEAAAAGPRELAKRFGHLVGGPGAGAGGAAPPRHPESMRLLDSLAHRHELRMAEACGALRVELLAAARRYRERHMMLHEVSHSRWTNQRDRTFFLRLQEMLVGGFLPPQRRKEWQHKFESICSVHFGQPRVPPDFSLVEMA